MNLELDQFKKYIKDYNEKNNISPLTDREIEFLFKLFKDVNEKQNTPLNLKTKSFSINIPKDKNEVISYLLNKGFNLEKLQKLDNSNLKDLYLSIKYRKKFTLYLLDKEYNLKELQKLDDLSLKNLYEIVKEKKISISYKGLTGLLDSSICDIDEFKNIININNKRLSDMISIKFENIISSLKNRSFKALVIYHNADIDGHFVKISSEIYKMFDNNNEFIYKSCGQSADEAYECILEHVNEVDAIFIADLSFTEDMCKKIDEHEEIKDKLILLDHHDSSYSYINEYDWALCKPNNIYNLNLSSGTLLYSMLLSLIKNENINDELNLFYLIKNLSINIAAYDTWFVNDFKTKDICEQLGYTLGNDYTLLFKYDKKNFDSRMINNIKYSNELLYHCSLERKEELAGKIDTLLSEEDKTIINISKKNIQNIVSNAWHGSIIGSIGSNKFAVVYIHNYSSEVGQYILEHQKEIDFVIEIMMNSQNISFRSRNDEYDVAKLAKENNGGGHKAASGSDYLMKNSDLYNLSLKDILYRLLSKVYSDKEFDEMILKRIKEYNFDEEKHVYVIE